MLVVVVIFCGTRATWQTNYKKSVWSRDQICMTSLYSFPYNFSGLLFSFPSTDSYKWRCEETQVRSPTRSEGAKGGPKTLQRIDYRNEGRRIVVSTSQIQGVEWSSVVTTRRSQTGMVTCDHSHVTIVWYEN